MDRRQFVEVCAGWAVSSFLPFRSPETVQRIVVAGGGIIGFSIAYHLARRGAQVTLLEKVRPAAGATEKSFAWINATYSKLPRAYFELNRLGMAGWQRLQRELEGQLHVQWGGGVEWHPAGEDAEELRRGVIRQQGWGYPTRLISEAELLGFLPGIIPGNFSAASFCEQEGTVDPVHAVGVLLKAAERQGARVLFPCEVTGLDLASHRIRGVQTTQGNIEADALVVACGVDTSRVAAMAGVSVPLKDSPGVLAHTTPLPRLLERVALAPGANMKQNPDGRVVTGSDFGGSPGTDSSEKFGRKLLLEAARFLPGLKGAPLERVTLGWRVMPRDEYPIIGFADACPNLYVAAMHSGITLAPLVGQFAATEILDGARIDLLQPYRPARFA